MRKRLYLFIAICWLAGMSAALFYPFGSYPPTLEKITYYDKAAHLVMYGVLMYLLLAAGIRWKKEKFFWIFMTAFSLTTILNVGAEFIQSFIPGREPSWLDFLAGLAGTLVAVPVTYILHHSPRPRALLHVCCAPCAAPIREILSAGYRLDLFFHNPNIHPEKEYLKRLKEVKKLAARFGLRLIAGKYERTGWQEAVAGYENEPEGGARCELCFRYRLRVAAALAQKRGIRFFGTTLTISPHKNSGLINKIGQRIGDWFGVFFINKDFKENNGWKKSLEFSRQFGFYRQKYCGCEYSQKKPNN